jgi:hypothetical protein
VSHLLDRVHFGLISILIFFDKIYPKITKVKYQGDN